MRRLIARLFPTDMYTDPLAQRRAVATYVIIAVTLVSIGAAALNYLVSTLIGRSVAAPLSALILRGVVLSSISIAALVLTRRKRQEAGAGLIVISWFALIGFVMFSGEVDYKIGYAGMLVGVSLGALLIGDWTVLYAVPVSLFFVAVAAVSTAPGTAWVDVFILTMLMIVHTSLNYALARNIRTVARQVAADVEERRVRLTRASTALVQRLLALRLDLDSLLAETVTLVRDTFPDIDDAQLFLVDKDRKKATLVASTSLTDRAQVGQQQVGVGSLSVIGRVTIGGQTVVVRDTTDEQPYRRAAFLAGTRAEAVIPLRVGGEIIGALDAQSQNVEAFGPDEVEVLETLANQIAVVIDNARLFAEAQAKLAENQRLYDQASSSLREIERLNQQLTGGAWTEYLRGMSSVPAYTIDMISGRVEDAAEWTPTLSEASRRGQVIIRTGQHAKVLSLPITVRGQVIGAMEFELAPDQHIGPDQMVILQQVIERLGLAAENIRLLDEAQRIAQREAMVNEITARMQAATSVEAVVAAATQSLADAFEAPRVAIRLGNPAEGGLAAAHHSGDHADKIAVEKVKEQQE